MMRIQRMAKSGVTMAFCTTMIWGVVSSCRSHGECPDELTPVMYNGLCGYVDLKGRFVIESQFDKPAYFFNDVAFVERNGKLGIIDRSGRVVCDFKYEPTELPNYSFQIPF